MDEKIRDISLLVAEDEKELLAFITEYLHLFFEKIYSATNGEDALKIYHDKRPDIIITDINMPSLDGLSLIEKIRKEDKQTRIFIMSAHSEEEKLLQAIGLHLETYLIKPINVEKLKNSLLKSVEEIRAVSKRLYLDENLYWDKVGEKLFKNSREVVLKTAERRCMKLLCQNPGEVVSAQEIFHAVHKQGRQIAFSHDSVTSLIKRLRTKLPEKIVKNVYGAGYKVVPLF